MDPPDAFNFARAAVHVRIVPVRLIASTCSNTPTSCSAPRRMIPAQFTSTSSRGRSADQRADGGFVAHVERHGVAAAKVGRGLRRRALGRRGARDRDHRAQPRECVGNTGADAGRPADDQHHLAREEVRIERSVDQVWPPALAAVAAALKRATSAARGSGATAP